MEAFYHVSGFTPEDGRGETKGPDKMHGRQADALANFRRLVASGKYDYVIVEWCAATNEGQPAA